MSQTAQAACYNLSAFAQLNEVCEVCGGNHGTWKCCETCNLDRHICHFCGDTLGHFEASDCYEKCLDCTHIGHEHSGDGRCFECDGKCPGRFRTAYQWLTALTGMRLLTRPLP